VMNVANVWEKLRKLFRRHKESEGITAKIYEPPNIEGDKAVVAKIHVSPGYDPEKFVQLIRELEEELKEWCKKYEPVEERDERG